MVSTMNSISQIATMLHIIIIYSGVFYSVAFAPKSDAPNKLFDCSNTDREGEVLRCRQSRSIFHRPLRPSSLRLPAAPDSKSVAKRLYEENSMPLHDKDIDTSIVLHDLAGYDQDSTSPLESEFKSLMATFLTYTKRDIRSLTSTSCRYLDYAQSDDGVHKAHVRSKETGIRYRVLFEGVQSGACEPAVMRSFSVLFEDYLPIRLAGRRIYSYLGKVIEEIRLERQGEIQRAKEICSWDRDVIEYAHDVWDNLMDESLLREGTLNTDDSKHQPQDVGVLSITQLIHLSVDEVFIEMDLIRDRNEFRTLCESIVNCEETTIEYKKNDPDTLEVTFVSFVRLLHQISSEPVTRTFMERLQSQSVQHRQSNVNGDNISAILATNAMINGSDRSCEKRQRHSDRFDEYVSTFKIWEDRFVGKQSTHHPSRRLDILRGCFGGARDPKVVAALKIVYMDYAALRLAGDLIFKLMSKIAG